ncbi:MAG: universal stress protein [Gordonia sp. (in: high G+C Gram-positive bacteria)]
MSASIVVGIDGSAAATTALRWAAETANREHRTLTVLGVFDPLAANHAPEPIIAASVLDAISADVTAAVHEAVASARTQFPGLEVEGRVAAGTASAVLIDAANHASLAVVGTRHLSGVKGLFLGSVSTSVAAHATGPVAVIAGETGPGPVVAGVDGSPLTQYVLRAAFHQAAKLKVGVTVVHSWTDLSNETLAGQHADADQLFVAGAGVHESIGQWILHYSDVHPDIPVNTVVAADGPVHHILTAGRDASLIVVGSRGRGGFAGTLLGSTSQAILHHATRPVLIVKQSFPLDEPGPLDQD